MNSHGDARLILTTGPQSVGESHVAKKLQSDPVLCNFETHIFDAEKYHSKPHGAATVVMYVFLLLNKLKQLEIRVVVLANVL